MKKYICRTISAGDDLGEWMDSFIAAMKNNNEYYGAKILEWKVDIHRNLTMTIEI